MRKTLTEAKVSNQALESMNQFHAAAVSEVEQALLSNEWVIVGMKQNPVVTKARKFMNDKNMKFHYIEHGSYFSKWKPRLAIKLWSGWPTFPQVFHKGVLIGGCAELMKYLKANN